jgi:6-phosphogluconolactonase
MVKESLLDRIAIPSENVFPISTQPLEPHKAAQAYAKTLVAQCGDTPEFDLILLGLGGDGHTASLFPGMDFKSMERKLVVVTESPVEPCVRISITLDVINRAQNVFFLVAGEEKVEILKHVLKSRNKSEPPYPASRVKPQGKLKWFVDKSAATDP